VQGIVRCTTRGTLTWSLSDPNESSQYGVSVAGEQRTSLGDDRPNVPKADTLDGSAPAQSDGHHVRFPRLHRFRAGIRRRPGLNVAWRVGVFIVGVLITLAGVAMLALPGPGWAAIFIGLAVLATEFAWAHHLLHNAKERVQQAAHKAKDPKRRRLLLILGAVLVVVVAAAGWWYVDRYGWSLPW
jgi:uncharacterized protein (TIGR02611 family)